MAPLNACTSRAGEDIGEGEGGGYLRGLLHSTSMITNFGISVLDVRINRRKRGE